MLPKLFEHNNYAPVHLTKMADWKQDGSFTTNSDQDWPFPTKGFETLNAAKTVLAQ